MAIMVASFRQALDAWLVGILPADVYVRASASGDSGLPDAGRPGAHRRPARRARAPSSCASSSSILDPSRPRVVLLARSIDPAEPARRLPLVSAARCRRQAPRRRCGSTRPWSTCTVSRPARWSTIPLGGTRHGIHRRRRVARLRAAAGRDGDRARALCRADRRCGSERGRALARAGGDGRRACAARSHAMFQAARDSTSPRPARSARCRCTFSTAPSR